MNTNEILDARFKCGCWFSEVGALRIPAITGVMCCPIHEQSYGENPERRPFKRNEGPPPGVKDGPSVSLRWP